MGRKLRIWLPYAYHHICSRGNNRKNIFQDTTDYVHAFQILEMIHERYPISICGFCLMTNHYHFLLKSEQASISKIMSLFNKRYSDYYNRKYQHVGHVFQQRFRSSPLPSPEDLLYVSKYIHRNPIATKIPIVANMEDYPYSSYQYYKKKLDPPYSFIHLDPLTNCFPLKEQKANQHYCDYVEAKIE